MDAMTIYQAGTVSKQKDISPALFRDFIEWIDRSDKTARTYITNLKQFAAWLNYAGITKPTRENIISYRQYLCSEHQAIQYDPAAGWTYRKDGSGEPVKVQCKPNTVVQYIRVVRQFFKWTAAEGLYPDIAANIHAPKLKRDTHRREYLQPKEVQEIEISIADQTRQKIAAAAASKKDYEGRVARSTEQGKRLKAMYALAVTAGLRTVEISRANVRDFVSKGGQAWLYIWGKGHTEPDQKKPIAPQVAAALSDYLATRSDRVTGAAPLFVSTGNRSGGKRIAATTISKILKRAMQEAGYNDEKLTAHSLRHTAAMGVLEITGSNLYETQKYMRHTNPATTEIYLHETEKQEQQEAAIAENVYSLFHGQKNNEGSRTRLESIVNRMTPDQLKKLTEIAEALA